ncbi:response regulator transcription factor [Dyadobacter sp. CY312]|uniref:response regulator transcription factor n=1 Tax=Dyadobacter sp. CY312 TaxID=2907303 RepID=UPI001F17FB12|nr:response regulator transcription factor [Dyadobacter sp. CY312]MCE7042800.1 response regulator transcription factor [Dyadobacter sp. CY312]
MNGIKIGLIDKNPVLRKGLHDVLCEHFQVVAILESNSVFHFFETFPAPGPDLIIKGVNSLEDENNVESVVKVRKWYPHTKVILYDQQVNPSMVNSYLAAGVKGYISKEDELKEVIDCVTQVANGNRYLNNESLWRVLNTFNFEGKQKLAPPKRITLTARELEIAEYLVDGMGVTWIAQKLGRKPSTISTTKKKIFTITKVDSVLKLRDKIKPGNL